MVTKPFHAMNSNDIAVKQIFCKLDDFVVAFDKKFSEHLI
jgi:hypothetical protein